MSTVFIGRASALQTKNSIFIQTLDIRNSVLLALEEHSNSEIIIVSNRESAYHDAKIACFHKVKFHLNNTTTVTSTMKQFEKALFLFELASTYYECESAEEHLIKSLLQVVPSIIREDQAIYLIKQASNNIFKKSAVKSFKTVLQFEKDEVKSTISINEDYDYVTFVDIPYGEELANHMLNLHNSDIDSLNIMNAFLAGGKTTTLIKAFNKFCDQGSKPIVTGCTRALMASLLPKGDPRYDMEALKSRGMPKGLLGVVNTVLMNGDFAKERQASEVFMVDEIEEVQNHMSGGAVGSGTLNDKVNIYSRFEEQIKKSKTVVVTDALASEFTINYLIKLAKESDKKVFVYRQESTKKKPVVKVMSEAMNISAARGNLKNNKKIAIFNDGSNNKTKSAFNALYNAINPTNGFSIKIDAAFMQSKATKHRLSDPDALADDMVAIFYNSAAKCGLSVQNAEYKDAHVFGCGTVVPNEYVQAPGRFRDTETIFQSFSNSNHRLPPQTTWAILSNIMNKECTPEEFTQEKQRQLFEDPMIKTVLARIEYKNKMKKNYQNKVLFMYEILGFEVQFVEEDDKQASYGRRNKKRGSRTERELHCNGVVNASKITRERASELRDCGDYNSQARKDELESFDLRNFYKVKDVTEDLHEFDNAAKGRTTITNMMIARGDIECKKVETQIAQEMIAKFFEITDLNPINFGEYNRAKAIQLQSFLNIGEIKVGERIVSAEEAFYKAFPNSNITARAMSIISSVLVKSFMLTPPKSHDRKGSKDDWNYLAIPNEQVEEHYDRITSYNKKAELVKVETPCEAPLPELEPMKQVSDSKLKKEVQLELIELGSIEELLALSKVA